MYIFFGLVRTQVLIFCPLLISWVVSGAMVFLCVPQFVSLAYTVKLWPLFSILIAYKK